MRAWHVLILPWVKLVAGKERPRHHSLNATCPAASTTAFGFLGDGVCDKALNNADCGFDLGDCCASTSDGRGPFGACVDPSEAVFEASCGAAHATRIGDGRCDRALDTEACLYDGGDCCGWSCRVRDCVPARKSEKRCRSAGINGADAMPECVCESKTRMSRGPAAERYFAAILWPPVAAHAALAEHALRMIAEVADVVQWSSFDPGANFSAFLYEVYGSDRTLSNWTWIDMKRDWFAAHAASTAIFALIRLHQPSRWNAQALTAQAVHRLKMPIRRALGPRIPAYVDETRDVTFHVTDTVYQTRATLRAVHPYLRS